MTTDIEAFKDRLRDLILDHGFAVQHEDHELPSVGYTVGRTMHHRPELLVSGLPINYAHAVLSEAVKRDNERPLTPGELVEIREQLYRVSKIPGLPCRAEEPMASVVIGAAMTFSSLQVEGYQLLWPDDAGNYPGDEDYSVAPEAQRRF